MKNISISLLSLILLAMSAQGVTRKPASHSDLELISDITKASHLSGNMRVETATGIPRAIYSPNWEVTPAIPESMAREYLGAQQELLAQADLDGNLKYLRTAETPGGYRVQFMQTFEGHEVYLASIKISINRDHQVVFATNGYQPIDRIANRIQLDELTALELAGTYLGLAAEPYLQKAELILYPRPLHTGLWTYRVIIVPGGKAYGDWELLVDAETGEIVRAEDKACYQGVLREDGSGWVFDPDPVTNAQTRYGQSQFTNNGDADSDSLTAQLKEVVLEDLSYDGNLYQLVGPYAAIIDVESPFTGFHAQDSANFHFTRSQPGFEAVNTYYHIHNTMKYLNETLGFQVMPFQYEGGVHFDPRALDGDANAYYTGSTGWVAFGVPSGAVDAAEDHAIVLHEMGHGIHDWITVGGLSQVEGLSEGLGDYWAQSYTRSLGQYSPQDAEYDYFGMWGLQPFGSPSLRVTNFPNHYPEGLGGEVHYDGQLWSSSLMSIWDAIGRTATDTDCWEAISMTDMNTNQMDAAFAFLQADMDIYDGGNISGIMPAFIDRGYLPGPVVARFEADITGGPCPLTVNFSDHSFVQQPPIVSWAWDFNTDGIIDSHEQNPSFTFTEPGLYTVSLTISDGSSTHTITEEKFISANDGVLIFDGQAQAWNVVDYSGQFMLEQFTELGVAANYSNRLWSSLRGYDAVFVSLGNLGMQAGDGTFLSDKDLNAIVEYVSYGGKLYIEGGSLMGGAAAFGGDNYQEFWELFGIQTATFNYSQHILTSLIGQPGTLAENLSFNASTQVNSWYIDTVTGNEAGSIVFQEPGYGSVAIQHAGTNGQRTVYLAYSLAALVDGELQNSRRQLLINILEFFGTPLLIPAFSASVGSGHAPLSVEFNDASGANPEVLSWAWDFNGDGVADSDIAQPTWVFEESGDYDVSLTVGNGDTTRTIMIPSAIRVFAGESALALQENDNGVYVPATASLNASSGLTLEAWINPVAWGDEDNGDGRLLDKGYYRLFLNRDGSNIYPDSTLCILIKHEDGTLSKASAMAHDIQMDLWQHVAVTYDGGSSDLHVYINGHDRTQIHTAPSGPIKDNSDKELIIGNAPNFNKAFQGRLDEIRIWDRAESAENILTRMDQYLGGNELGLTAYWSMNEAYGSYILDASSNANHGMIYDCRWEWGTDFVVPVALDEGGQVPDSRLLITSYPNPFNASTRISYNLPQAGLTTLSIYDIRGAQIRTLDSGERAAGWYTISWDAVDADGHNVPAGLYFCSIRTQSGVRTTKMLLLK